MDALVSLSGEPVSATIDSVSKEAEALLQGSARLKIHLEFIDLLGLCSKERNYIAERFCRDAISLEAASEVMLREGLGLEVIVPYIRFMHGVFFTTEVVGKKQKRGQREADELTQIVRKAPQRFMTLFKDVVRPAFLKISEIYLAKKQAVIAKRE